jgi:hypothetical protein
MTIKHNKKRNIALIAEFFARYVSEKLIEGDEEQADKAIKIFNEHFSNKSILRKELRLVSALSDTVVRTKEAAYKILYEIKKDAKKTNNKRLEREKNVLIKAINYNFGKSFYEQRISEYNKLGSIHNLLNEYRGNGSINNKVHVVKFEEDVVDYLMNPTSRNQVQFEMNQPEKYNKLVIGFMNKRFEEKYKGKLNEEQARLLKAKAGLSDESIVDVVKDIKVKIFEAVKKLKEDNEVVESELALTALNEVDNYFQNNDMKIGSDDCIKCWFNAAEFINETKEKENI